MTAPAPETPSRDPLGARLSAAGARFAGNPVAQAATLAFTVAWLVLGGSENMLMILLAVGSLVLTQMVLNQQRRRERALQIKIDELLIATGGARSELAGIESRAEEEIEQLRRDQAEAT